jgi:hypothetical protein
MEKEEGCKCMWCKAGVSTEEALNKRVDFLVASFALMFARLFNLASDSVVKQTNDFKDVITTFINSEDRDNKPVFSYIVDTCFFTVGLGGSLSPTQIYEKSEEIDEMVAAAFRLFRADVHMEETPILTGLLTPEIFVETQFDVDSLPSVLKTMYNKYENQTNPLTHLLESLGGNVQFQMFDMDNEQAEQQEHKVLH